MPQLLRLPYIVYLLRIWSSSETNSAWRYSLENPVTGARRGFASMDEMTHFLQQETAKDRDQSEATGIRSPLQKADDGE